jgi:hypothetical protein
VKLGLVTVTLAACVGSAAPGPSELDAEAPDASAAPPAEAGSAPAPRSSAASVDAAPLDFPPCFDPVTTPCRPGIGNVHQ